MQDARQTQHARQTSAQPHVAPSKMTRAVSIVLAVTSMVLVATFTILVVSSGVDPSSVPSSFASFHSVTLPLW